MCDSLRALHDQLEIDGYAVPRACVGVGQCALAIEESASLPSMRVGLRNPLSQSEALRKIETMFLRAIASDLLGATAFPVRSILFDKRPAANWDVMWHQDVTIAVRECFDVEGFGPWSVKAGVPHVQPTAAVLEKMVTLRLHLDDCPAENGPLLVVPGSHARGFIDVRTLDVAACDQNAVACTAAAGDVVAIRPLILHASRKATTPSHRRVLHVEYACHLLPGGLAWTDASRE